MHVPLLTYSVPLPSLDDVFCTQGTFWRLILYTYFPMFDLFSTTTTSWWPCLFTCEFIAYFVYLLLLREISYDYMGAYLWWTILYTYLLLMTYIGLFCTHTSSCLNYSLQIPPLHHVVCTLGNFMAYLVFFILGELKYTCDILWLHVPLVTYSVHLNHLCDLFCK